MSVLMLNGKEVFFLKINQYLSIKKTIDKYESPLA